MTPHATILVVEDEAAQALAIRTVLEANHYRVIVAADGNEGWAQLQTAKPDLVVLDLMLPKLSGLDILSLAQRDRRTKSIPIIVLSNVDAEDVITRAKTLGARDHLVKTAVHPEDVVHKVQQHLSRRRTTQSL